MKKLLCDDTEDLLKKDLEFDLKRISNYFEENQLIVNLKKGKTETMIFGTSKRVSNVGKFLNVNYRGLKINSVTV